MTRARPRRSGSWSEYGYWQDQDQTEISVNGEEVANGRIDEIQEIGDDEVLAQYNTQLNEQFKDVPVEQTIAMLLKDAQILNNLINAQMEDAENQKLNVQ